MRMAASRRALVAALLSLSSTACWPSGAAAVLLTRGGGSSSDGAELAGTIVVSGANGASLDWEEEAEPNDRRADARRLALPDHGAHVVRGEMHAGRRFSTLHGAGPASTRAHRQQGPAHHQQEWMLPAGGPDLAPDWIAAGDAGVLVLAAGSDWQAELQDAHGVGTPTRWMRSAAGPVRGVALLEDLLFVLVSGPTRCRLLLLDPWTGQSRQELTLPLADAVGLGAALDPALGVVQVVTVDIVAGRVRGFSCDEAADGMQAGPLEDLGPLPATLRPESLAFDGDLIWCLDAAGAAHGWCRDDGGAVVVVPSTAAAEPARRLAVQRTWDRDAMHLVVPAGRAITLQWWAAAEDLATLTVLDRTAGLDDALTRVVATRQVTGPTPQRRTVTLRADTVARSFDLLQTCRSGAATWALVTGEVPGPVALAPLPAPATDADTVALARHAAGHPADWRHHARRHAWLELPGPVDAQVAVAGRAATLSVPAETGAFRLREHHRSPAGYRVLDLEAREAAAGPPDAAAATLHPRADQQRRTRDLLQLLDELERRPDVAWAEAVPLARALGVTPNDPYWGWQRWAHDRLKLTRAWTYTRGSPSVVIGVVDTGVRTEHDDLAPVLLPGYDFVDDPRNSGDGDGMDPDPYDDGGFQSHGTHVAGTIAARGDDGFGICGVVMDGRVLPVRAIGADGTGNLSDVAEAIRYAAGLSNRSGTTPATPCQVLNLSLGAQTDFTPLRLAVTAALDAGVVVLAAAGNDGRAGLLYPAAYRRVIAVGASTIDDRRALYSNTGSRLDVLAPGGEPGDRDADGQPDQIYSCIGDPAGARPGGFQYLMGTSMACAHASGVAALLKALQPDASPADVATWMTSTAKDLGPAGFDPSHGYGRLDAFAAMQQMNPILSLNTAAVDLGDNGTAFVVQLSNLGGGTLTVDGLTTAPVVGPGGWLTATLLGDGRSLALQADRTGLAPGPHAVDLTVSTNGGVQTLPVTLNRSLGPLPDLGPVLVEVRTQAGALVQRRRTRLDRAYRWRLVDLPRGDYVLHCGVDLDGDGVLGGPGEPYGVYPARTVPVPIQLSLPQLVTDLVLE